MDVGVYRYLDFYLCVHVCWLWLKNGNMGVCTVGISRISMCKELCMEFDDLLFLEGRVKVMLWVRVACVRVVKS